VAGGGPLVIGDPLVLRVQVPDCPPQVEGHPLAFRVAPDALQGLALPEPFGQGRAVIRRAPLGANQAEGAARIDFTDALDRRSGCHSAPDDQVRVVRHWSLRMGWDFLGGRILVAPYSPVYARTFMTPLLRQPVPDASG